MTTSAPATVCAARSARTCSLNDDGYAEVLATEVPAEHEDDVRAAVNQCPSLAISIE